MVTRTSQLPTILVSHGRLTGADAVADDPYLTALAGAGARYSLCPTSIDPHEAHSLLAASTGLLLCGGVDVDPSSYGQRRSPWCGESDLGRDRRERALIEAALSLDVPLLAICRGIQMLNVALGGTLYQDIPTEVGLSVSHRVVEAAAKGAPAHLVEVEPGSNLEAVLGSLRPAVNSRHHQALRDVADSLTIVAKAPDGVVEAVEASGHRFAIAVQWHPEDMVACQTHASRLFGAFVAAASPGTGA